MVIIGITGTLASGKGSVVEFLKQRGFKHFSVRDFIREEVLKRGLPVNRDTLVAVANDLREKNSPSYLAEQLYAQAKQSGSFCVIESLRTLGEIEMLKEKSNFYLLAVDGDQKLRYERSQARASETDKITFEKFQEQEEREMHSDDPNKQNLHACIDRADYKIMNNSTLEELKSVVTEFVFEFVMVAESNDSTEGTF